MKNNNEAWVSFQLAKEDEHNIRVLAAKMDISRAEFMRRAALAYYEKMNKEVKWNEF